MEKYISLLIMALIAISVPFAMLFIQWLISPKPTDYGDKLEPYESGEVPLMDAWVRYPVRFYMVAFLFLLFDIEAALIFPFAVVFDKLGLFAIVEGFIFIGILFVGWLFLYREKAYKWE